MSNPKTAAKAERISVSEEIVTTMTKWTPMVQLTLTEEQAQFLKDILSKVGGDPFKTRRAVGDQISAALGKAGFRFTERTSGWNNDELNPKYDLSGGITVHAPGMVPRHAY